MHSTLRGSFHVPFYTYKVAFQTDSGFAEFIWDGNELLWVHRPTKILDTGRPQTMGTHPTTALQWACQVPFSGPVSESSSPSTAEHNGKTEGGLVLETVLKLHFVAFSG